MKDVELLLDANGGIVSTAQLIGAGMAPSQIRRLGWRRPRRGWHACPTADPKVEQAVRTGGVFGCVSVLKRYGIWVPDHGLHVRAEGDCQPYRWRPRSFSAIDTLDVALASAVNCLDSEGVIVILDSALNLRLIEMADATTLVKGSKYAHLRLDEKCDGRSESGLETITRLRLRARHIKVRLQVEIGTVGRVDLLVGKSLVIECDGQAYHSFDADRERDRRLRALGFQVIRLSYNHVMHDWAAAEQDLLAVIRRREHEWPAQICV